MDEMQKIILIVCLVVLALSMKKILGAYDYLLKHLVTSLELIGASFQQIVSALISFFLFPPPWRLNPVRAILGLVSMAALIFIALKSGVSEIQFSAIFLPAVFFVSFGRLSRNIFIKNICMLMWVIALAGALAIIIHENSIDSAGAAIPSVVLSFTGLLEVGYLLYMLLIGLPIALGLVILGFIVLMQSRIASQIVKVLGFFLRWIFYPFLALNGIFELFLALITWISEKLFKFTIKCLYPR